MSERMTAEELAVQWERTLGDAFCYRDRDDMLKLIASLIDADRRETERLCAERAYKWWHGVDDVDWETFQELRAAITSPAKEDKP